MSSAMFQRLASWLRDRWIAMGPDEEESDPELQRLLARARALPREMELDPERDLWAGILDRIGDAPEASAATPAQPTLAERLAVPFPRPALAAGLALALVVVTSLVTLRLVGAPPEPPSDAEVRAIAERMRARDGVSEVRDGLIALLASRRADLPPEVLASVEENLRSIDRAIADVHLALEAHPDNPALQFLIAEAYRSEAELLERLEWWLHVPEEATS